LLYFIYLFILVVLGLNSGPCWAGALPLELLYQP
jgi:hypothetical protein